MPDDEPDPTPTATAPTVETTPTPVPTPTVEPTPTPVPQYISVSGTKTWVDNDDAEGRRPESITVRLLQNGAVIQEQTVTAASGWRYTFSNLPQNDPATGEAYTYTINERIVNGYYARVDGYNLENTLIPDAPVPRIPHDPNDPATRIIEYRTPLGVKAIELTEEDLEGLMDLFDYGTPLWGGLLGTGDEVPVYPFVFGGIGIAAVIALLLSRKKRKGMN